MSGQQYLRVFFPVKLRTFPHRHAIRIGLRTVHLLTMAVLLGGHVFEQPVDVLQFWLVATITSGVLLLLTDLYASMAILFELRSLAAVIKIGLVLLVPFFWQYRIFLLVTVLVIGAVSSHLSGQLRHKRWLFKQCDSMSYDKYK